VSGRILRADELQPRPWRNGLGVTREIALCPPGADTDDFLWRASVADVVGAAPFSLFPGVERIIALLDGAGFRMILDGARTHHLTTPFAPFAFDGEASVEVQLAGGPTRDFNLMTRRGLAEGRIDVWQGPAMHACTDDLALLYVARGHVDTSDGQLDAGDSWLPDAAAMPPVHLADRAVVLAVRVRLSGG
jgi:uncharacterized protein